MVTLMLALVAGLSLPATAAQVPYHVRWLVAHNPTNQAVLELLNDFSRKVEKRTDSRLTVSILPLDNRFVERHPEALKEVLSGDVEMSQVSVGELAKVSPTLGVLGLPYLFNGHDHVAAVVNGPIGNALRDEFFERSGLKARGMAFTYSGGFQVLYGRKPVRSLEDLRSTTIWPNSPVFLRAGVPELRPRRRYSREQAVQALLDGTFDLEEAELNRFYVLQKDYPKLRESVKFVAETNHSVYLTMIVVNERFFAGLPADLRTVLSEEVQDLASREKALSIRQAEEAKAELSHSGVTFTRLDDASVRRLKTISADIVSDFDFSFPGWVGPITALGARFADSR